MVVASRVRALLRLPNRYRGFGARDASAWEIAAQLAPAENLRRQGIRGDAGSCGAGLFGGGRRHRHGAGRSTPLLQ